MRAGIAVGHYSPNNAGKGAAIRIGIDMASGDVILIQDGDLEYDPNDYHKLLEPIVRGEADVVYGSRFLGRPSGMATRNRIANRVLTAAANLCMAPASPMKLRHTRRSARAFSARSADVPAF